MTIGVDIGGVITDPPPGVDHEDFLGGRSHLLIQKVKDSFNVIRVLNEKHRVILVSKARPVTQRKTTEWLRHHQFFKVTGMSERDVYYTLSRDDKTRIAEREGVTHFIDDKLEVLGYMYGIVPNLFCFQCHPLQKQRYPFIYQKVRHVTTWEELRMLLVQ
jgi:hypothetical protein